MGILFLVATPIGNLEDISFRALNILKSVVLVAAEDTRQTIKILKKFEILTPLISYHEHNKLARVDSILNALSIGDVALVSDAGTPGLNDPGYELVREVIAKGFTVSAVPGPSAPLMALVISGLPTDAFLYLGYLPRKRNERRHKLEEIAGLPYTLIFLEVPHRLRDALADLDLVLGTRQIAIARELTKVHEEVFRGTIAQAVEHFSKKDPRGEFTLVIHGHSKQQEEIWAEEILLSRITEEIKSGKPISQLATELSQNSGWARRDIYRIGSQIKGKRDETEDGNDES